MKSTVATAGPADSQWFVFISEWKAVEEGGADPVFFARWERFFADYALFAASLPEESVSVLDMLAAEQFFNQFRVLFDDYWKSTAAVSIWDVAGLNADEVRTCAVLAWLLDCHGSHGQRTAFMQCFLDCVDEAASEGCKALLPSAEDLDRGYRTRVEQAYAAGDAALSSSRVDIEIEGRAFVLFVEAKIYAPETNNQMERYAALLRSKAVSKRQGLVYLTPHGGPPRNGDANTLKQVVPLRWRQVAAHFLRYVKQKMDQKAFGTICIRQFCEHVAKF